MTTPTSNEEFESRLTHSFQVGISAGWDEVATWLHTQASNAFTRRKDSEANLLRDLADKARAKAKDLHPGPPKRNDK